MLSGGELIYCTVKQSSRVHTVQSSMYHIYKAAFWIRLFLRHKWDEIFKFFNFSSIVCVKRTNLLTFLNIFKIYLLVWSEKEEESGSGAGFLNPNNLGSGRIRIWNHGTNAQQVDLTVTYTGSKDFRKWSNQSLNTTLEAVHTFL